MSRVNSRPIKKDRALWLAEDGHVGSKLTNGRCDSLRRERAAQDVLSPQGRNKLKVDILTAVWVQEMLCCHQVWQDACSLCIILSMNWDELQSSVCRLVSTVSSPFFKILSWNFQCVLSWPWPWCVAQLFLLQWAKRCSTGPNVAPGPKSVSSTFLHHFSSNWVEISCVMPGDSTLIDQVSDHPLNWFLRPCWTKTRQKMPIFQLCPIWLKIGGYLH